MDRRSQFGNQGISFQGLTDPEGAKQVARKLFETYDRSMSGQIDNVEVVPMIAEAYKSFNRVYNPNRQDIESFAGILDVNKDGRITLQDLEGKKIILELCIRYLCGGQQPSQY